jgi:hypothetical protein
MRGIHSLYTTINNGRTTPTKTDLTTDRWVYPSIALPLIVVAIRRSLGGIVGELGNIIHDGFYVLV